MFDLKDTEVKLHDFAKQVQKYNEFWINVVISSLKNFQK